MGEIPEGRRKCHKQSGRHDESVFVHGQIMMDTMKQEMKGDANTIVGKIA